ncbi:uncharacterized protein LOC135388429 isoform X2 [Ornithodoros turicata]|uniref:uncharacterized protein LOC135388429 isoform X2 n=1 Tax=Ornithodoros turicata TaxID=34597 RepID=UPI003138EF69
MAAVVCLLVVPHAEIRRKCHLDEGTVSALKRAIMASSVLAPHVKMDDRFQVLDKDFNDFVDLDDGDEILHMSTIRAVRATSAQLEDESRAEVPISSLPEQSTPQAHPSGSVETICLTEMNDGSDHHGRDYLFPDFGTIHTLLRADAPVTSSLHKKIINILFQSMIKCSITPSRRFYSKVVTMLLARYPFLADAIGAGHESWLTSLTMKFKNERRKMPNDERVEANRLKYGKQTKRKPEGDSFDASEEVLKRRKLHSDITAHASTSHVEGEDDASARDHQEWLIKEHKKDAPNEELIGIRMQLTMKQRTAALVTLPVPTVKQTYPYLMDAARFFKECERRYGQHPYQQMVAALQRLRELAVRNRINCKEELRELIFADEARTGICERRRKHLLAIHALRILGGCVREPDAIDAMLFEEGKPLPKTPCVTFTGATIEDAEHMHVYVDKTLLFRVIDIEEAVSAILSAYWLFQIVYKKPYNMLCSLERLCLKVTESRARSPVIRFFNRHRNILDSCA